MTIQSAGRKEQLYSQKNQKRIFSQFLATRKTENIPSTWQVNRDYLNSFFSIFYWLFLFCPNFRSITSHTLYCCNRPGRRNTINYCRESKEKRRFTYFLHLFKWTQVAIVTTLKLPDFNCYLMLVHRGPGHAHQCTAWMQPDHKQTTSDLKTCSSLLVFYGKIK